MTTYSWSHALFQAKQSNSATQNFFGTKICWRPYKMFFFFWGGGGGWVLTTRWLYKEVFSFTRNVIQPFTRSPSQPCHLLNAILWDMRTDLLHESCRKTWKSTRNDKYLINKQKEGECSSENRKVILIRVGRWGDGQCMEKVSVAFMNLTKAYRLVTIHKIQVCVHARVRACVRACVCVCVCVCSKGQAKVKNNQT